MFEVVKFVSEHKADIALAALIGAGVLIGYRYGFKAGLRELPKNLKIAQVFKNNEQVGLLINGAFYLKRLI